MMTVIFRVILVIVSILTMAFMREDSAKVAKVQIRGGAVLGYHGPDSGGVLTVSCGRCLSPFVGESIHA